jgi:hypothetical protein
MNADGVTMSNVQLGKLTITLHAGKSLQLATSDGVVELAIVADYRNSHNRVRLRVVAPLSVGITRSDARKKTP